MFSFFSVCRVNILRRLGSNCIGTMRSRAEPLLFRFALSLSFVSFFMLYQIHFYYQYQVVLCEELFPHPGRVRFGTRARGAGLGGARDGGGAPPALSIFFALASTTLRNRGSLLFLLGERRERTAHNRGARSFDQPQSGL